jgi:hypothetical protein
MTVNEIVEKIHSFHNGKAIDRKAIKLFLTNNNIVVNEEALLKVSDAYNRRLLEEHDSRGRQDFADDHNSYINSRKELDLFIASISKNLSMTEIAGLKQKINDLIEKATLWSKR